MPPDKFRVALVQMSCGPEPEQNLGKALERVADAAGRGAQVVCLPELFQTNIFASVKIILYSTWPSRFPVPPATRWPPPLASMASC